MREPIASAINWTNPGPGAWGYEADDGSLFYGVAKWNLRPLDECAAENGYAFRYGVPPTPQQLHASCAASACIDLTNTVISGHEFAPNGVVDDGTHSIEYDVPMDDWVKPMIDYCMLHHMPGEPCPQDPLAQLLLDLKPIVDACEAQSRVSVMGVIDRGIRAREAYMASSGSGSARDAPWEGTPGLGGYDPDVAAMCAVPECDNLLFRLHMKFQMMGSCPFAQRNDVYNPLVYSYLHLCDLTTRVTWYDRVGMFGRGRGPIWYAYLPGPLPLSPSLSPSPSLPPVLSASPSSSPPLASSSEPTLTSPTESRPQTLPTPTPTSTPLSSPSSPAATLPSRPTASSNKTQQTRAANASAVVRPARANRTVPLPPTLASVDDEVTTPDTTTVASLTHQSGGSGALQYSVAAIVAVAVLTLLFVVRGYRRRRPAEGALALTATDDNGIGYHTLNESDRNGGISMVPSSTNPLELLASCTEIPATQLTDLRILGGGGFGVVYLVRDTQKDRLLASKRLAPKHTHAGAAAHSTHKHELDAFVAEINLAASLSHDRIVTFVGVAGLRKTALQALFEYMDGGDLRQYLDQRRPIADVDAEANPSSWTREKLQIAVDVADALVYLHSLTPTPVVHRDLKSRNILLTAKDKRAKLGDFGVSRTASSAASMTTGVGTSRWVAPEVILGGGAYGAACDVYSLGVVLSELDTHRVPFSELAHANGEPLADFAVLELVATQGRQPSFSASCPAGLVSLARVCLSFEATLRPSASEVGVALRAIQSELYEA